MDLPNFFPADVNRRLAGLNSDKSKKKFSVVFQDFGSCGHVDVRYSDSESSQSHEKIVVTQKLHQKQEDRAKLCARIPTIPLSKTAAEVHYPLRDGLMGELPLLPARITRFSRGLAQVSASLRQQVKWKWSFLTAKQTLDSLPARDGQVSDAELAEVTHGLPPSVRNCVSMYTDLSQRSSFLVNSPQYSGGLLSAVNDDSASTTTHLLFHARGRNLNKLALTITCPSAASIMVPSLLAAEDRVRSSVFQVDAANVGHDVFVATRHEGSCCVFSVSKAQCRNVVCGGVETCTSSPSSSASSCGYSLSGLCQSRVGGGGVRGRSEGEEGELSSSSQAPAVQFTSIGTCHFSQTRTPTSVCMSPYLPGEGLFCGESGLVKLWSARGGERGVVLMEVDKPPRFECRDAWTHAYYASHPRHVVLADRTAVQILDHRNGFRSSVDLFSLPSRLVHKRESITAARGVSLSSSSGSPLHLVATSHCVFVVDQRFGSTPVQSWYPDLEGAVQYLAVGEYDSTTTQGRYYCGKGVALVGSQYPAEVMCYPFNHDYSDGGGGGVNGSSGVGMTMSLKPWRLSRMKDVADHLRYPCFHGAIDPLLLEQRLDFSLAGLTTVKGPSKDSFLTYQADCYGEIFYQSYSNPHEPRTALKTGVPPPGRADHHVPVEVQAHVRAWMDRLDTQLTSLKRRVKCRGKRERIPRCKVWRLFRDKKGEEKGEGDECDSDSDKSSVSAKNRSSKKRSRVREGNDISCERDSDSDKLPSPSQNTCRKKWSRLTEDRSDSSPANEEVVRCSLCGDYIPTSEACVLRTATTTSNNNTNNINNNSHLHYHSSNNNGRLLCSSCHDFHGHSVSDVHTQAEEQCHSDRHRQRTQDSTGNTLAAGSAGGFDDTTVISERGGGYAVTVVNQGLAMLDQVLPTVDSYECADPFTAVHLELTKPQPQVLELVKKREEARAVILKGMISKNRRLEEEKKTKTTKRRSTRRSTAAEKDTVDAGRRDPQNTAPSQHSVFNTAEHQEQNARINAVISTSLNAKPGGSTASGDDSFSASFNESECELVSMTDNEVLSEMSFDLFGSTFGPGDGEEETKPQNLSQDDDDDFFGSSQDRAQSLNVTQDDDDEFFGDSQDRAWPQNLSQDFYDGDDKYFGWQGQKEPQAENLSQDDVDDYGDEFTGSQDLFAPSPTTPASQGLNISQQDTLSSLTFQPDSEDLFFTSSQIEKDSQSRSVTPRQRLPPSARKSRTSGFFSPHLSPISTPNRAKKAPTPSRFRDHVSSSSKRSQGASVSGSGSFSTLQDLSTPDKVKATTLSQRSQLHLSSSSKRSQPSTSSGSLSIPTLQDLSNLDSSRPHVARSLSPAFAGSQRLLQPLGLEDHGDDDDDVTVVADSVQQSQLELGCSPHSSPFKSPKPGVSHHPSPFKSPKPGVSRYPSPFKSPKPGVSHHPSPFKSPKPGVSRHPSPFKSPKPVVSHHPSPFKSPKPVVSRHPSPFESPEPGCSPHVTPFVSPKPGASTHASPFKSPHPNSFMSRRSLKFRTPDRGAAASPLALSSEKRKAKSGKKHKFSLEGF